MTDSGLENWDKVVLAIFQYIKLLKELDPEEQLRIFNEIKKTENLNWVSQDGNRASSRRLKLNQTTIFCENQCLLFDEKSVKNESTWVGLFFNWKTEVLLIAEFYKLAHHF